MARRLLIAAVVLVAAGCGGDELSSSEYRREAVDACKEARRDFRAVVREERNPMELGSKAGEISDRLFDRLLEPEVGPELRAEHDRLRELVDDVRRRTERIAEDGATEPRERKAIERRGRQVEALFRDMGVPVCARAFDG